jgi:hypothetical protein
MLGKSLCEPDKDTTEGFSGPNFFTSKQSDQRFVRVFLAQEIQLHVYIHYDATV